MLRVSLVQAASWRLTRQHLDEPAARLRDVASRLGGVHAQVMSSAEQILGVRAADATPEAVQRALWSRRSLVKTWAMRGTLHLLPSTELPTWVAALRTKQPKITPGWEKYHGVSKADVTAVRDALAEVLPGRTLTRDELATAVADHLGIPHLEERIRSGWGALLKPAANTGLLCFGPNEGQHVTFVSPRDWLKRVSWREPSEDDALRTVVRRFLGAYGPASHEDFARWWGVDPKTGREIIARFSDDLVQCEVDGKRAWATRECAADLPDTDPAGGVRLLPGFDPYAIAPVSQRRSLVPDGFLDRVSRTAGWISPVLLVGGEIRGVWELATRNGPVIEVRPFRRVPPAVRREAEAHAATYGRLLGAEPTVRWAKA